MKKKLFFGLILSIGLLMCSFGIVNNFNSQKISYAEDGEIIAFEPITYTYSSDKYSYVITLTSESVCEITITNADLLSQTLYASYSLVEDKLTITFIDERVLEFTLNADGTLKLIDNVESIYDEISQTATDFIVATKEILSQPIVVGGISTTLGAIILFLFSRLFSTLSTSRIKALGVKIETLKSQIDESVSKKQYTEVAKQVIELKDVLAILIEGTKNAKIKEKAQSLLLEIKPILEEAKEMVEKETLEPIVVQQIKKQATE